MTDKLTAQERREQLIQLYQDTFALCQNAVKSAKESDKPLRASFLREVNNHIRLGIEITDRLQELEKKEYFERSVNGIDEEADDSVLPFPVQGQQLKTS